MSRPTHTRALGCGLAPARLFIDFVATCVQRVLLYGYLFFSLDIILGPVVGVSDFEVAPGQVDVYTDMPKCTYVGREATVALRARLVGNTGALPFT